MIAFIAGALIASAALIAYPEAGDFVRKQVDRVRDWWDSRG